LLCWGSAGSLIITSAATTYDWANHLQAGNSLHCLITMDDNGSDNDDMNKDDWDDDHTEMMATIVLMVENGQQVVA
jgi:hypothetical protein